MHQKLGFLDTGLDLSLPRCIAEDDEVSVKSVGQKLQLVGAVLNAAVARTTECVAPTFQWLTSLVSNTAGVGVAHVVRLAVGAYAFILVGANIPVVANVPYK